MSVTVTSLGCGSSAGVPRPALGWGACDPTNPKNRRRRCSILIERTSPNGLTRVLVDTAPDLREQFATDAGEFAVALDRVHITMDREQFARPAHVEAFGLRHFRRAA